MRVEAGVQPKDNLYIKTVRIWGVADPKESRRNRERRVSCELCENNSERKPNGMALAGKKNERLKLHFKFHFLEWA